MNTTPSAPVARLALEDGTVFAGTGFGATDAAKTTTGEVVFNTAMTGYQEALTDPSYSGQILTMTTPMIGNYGVAAEDVESGTPQVAGFVVRELAKLHSNQRAVSDLSSWLAQYGVMGIQGIDTRALVRRLRQSGVMRGVISTDATKSDSELVALARSAPSMAGQNLARNVSPKVESDWTEDLGAWGASAAREAASGTEVAKGKKVWRVLALDCGAKRNIYRHLVERGCRVHVAPHDISAKQIRDFRPDGLFISNGPGDPEAVQATIATLREVAGEFPTFGICLGHQLLALALGAKTYKLKFGHRGANQPVRNVLTGKVEITSQNHGFCVEPDSLKGLGCDVTHLHMNDGTVAGFRHLSKPLFCVQYHPEASPGPHDSAYLFDCFLKIMATHRPITEADMLEASSPTVHARVPLEAVV